MKPLGVENAKFGLEKYDTKCDSVKDMIRILNTHTAYTDFRVERSEQIKLGQWDYQRLISLLNRWSTNPDYGKTIMRTITERKLP